MSITISKWGNSAGIRLPVHIINKLKLNINDRLNCSVVDNKIILEKEPDTELTIEQLFEGYEGEPENVTPFIFESVGDEKW